jgi:hypothetical protein
MGRSKSAAEALRLGCERSSNKDSNIVNQELVLRKLQPAVKRNYQKRMEQWLEYVYAISTYRYWADFSKQIPKAESKCLTI